MFRTSSTIGLSVQYDKTLNNNKELANLYDSALFNALNSYNNETKDDKTVVFNTSFNLIIGNHYTQVVCIITYNYIEEEPKVYTKEELSSLLFDFAEEITADPKHYIENTEKWIENNLK